MFMISMVAIALHRHEHVDESEFAKAGRVFSSGHSYERGSKPQAESANECVRNALVRPDTIKYIFILTCIFVV